jgi:hypothetical protein
MAGEAGEECAHRASYAPDEGGGRKHGCGDDLEDEAASAGVDIHGYHQWLYSFLRAVRLWL